MPSPFPGMNPYLEQESVWRDFHQRFIPVAAEFLSPQVSPAYIVTVGENHYIHEHGAEQRQLLGYGDVSVSRLEGGSPGQAPGGVLTAPAHFWLPRVDVVNEPFLEIRDKENRQLITVIELLSPTNKKAGEDREQYIAKRTQLMRSPTHFVEIDLLRGWERMPLIDGSQCDYYVLVSRVEDRPRVDWWPVRLADALPVVPIPLTTPEQTARLDLQSLLHRIYDAAYYRDYIYTRPPRPALAPETREWAAQFVAKG